MRTKLFAAALAILFSLALRADTPDQLVSQGRGLLVQQDLAGAKARFEAALTSAPNHPDANALLAVTRLLLLYQSPEGSALLNRLGFSATGRNLYNWQSEPPQDSNGFPVAPTNFSVAELSEFVRTNVMPAVRASETNLSRITNANYLLLLDSAETTIEGVAADYGDVLLMRAVLWYAQYASYAIGNLNLDWQFTEMSALFGDGSASFQGVLAAHPKLLTMAATNNLPEARAAYLQSVDLYLRASEKIRARSPNTIRLFNLDPDKADDELKFRQSLIDLTNSLTAPVVLSANTNLTVNLAPHFAGQTPPRSYFSQFDGNRFVLGTLPDPTFGGTILGLTRCEIEEKLESSFEVAIPLSGALRSNPARFELRFPTIPERAYLLQRSSDLKTWTNLVAIVATGCSYTNIDYSVSNSPARFYRLVDAPSAIRLTGLVFDSCSGQALAGAVVSTSLDGRTATTDALGFFSLQTRLGTNGYPFQVFVSESNHLAFTRTIYGSWELDDLMLGLLPMVSPAPANDQFANRIVLTGLPVAAPGTTCGATWVSCEPGNSSGGTVWWTWTAPATTPVTVQAQANVGNAWHSVQAFTGTNLCSLTYLGNAFTAVAGQTYQIAVASYSSSDRDSFTLRIAAQPTLTLNSPTNGAEFIATANIQVQASFQSIGNTLKLARLYADDELVQTTTNNPIALVWSNAPAGYHFLRLQAEDSAGQRSYAYANITVYSQNDDFANRIALTGTNLIVTGDNEVATREAGEPNHGGSTAENSVWWTWMAPASGPVTVSAFGDQHGSGNADYLGIYTGNSVSNLMLVASNAFGIPGYGSQATFNASAGTIYQIAVAGWTGGSLQLRLLTLPAPQVTFLTPTNGQLFEPGAAMTLTVAATNANAAIQNVAFMDESGVLGYDASTPYSLAFTAPLAPGFHTLSASALDAMGTISYSQPVTIRVVSSLACPGDDFNDSVKDPNRWGDELSWNGLSNQLVEIHGRLEPVATAEASAIWPWVCSLGSYTQDWEVVADVSPGNPTFSSTNGYASYQVSLAVGNADDLSPEGFPRDTLVISLALYGWQESVSRWFQASCSTNEDGFAYEEAESSNLTGAVRIIFNAQSKTLTAFFDADGSANGYAWNGLLSVDIDAAASNWGMNNSSKFVVGLGFDCYDELGLPGAPVFADNFMINGGFMPVAASRPLLRITRNAGQPVISIAGSVGSQVVLEYASALLAGTNWQALTTLTLTNNPQSHTDATAGSSQQRFYRARLAH